jgi:hypothetical protein
MLAYTPSWHIVLVSGWIQAMTLAIRELHENTVLKQKAGTSVSKSEVWSAGQPSFRTAFNGQTGQQTPAFWHDRPGLPFPTVRPCVPRAAVPQTDKASLFA